jgi:quercetin dioxygenase-like cupin family protein
MTTSMNTPDPSDDIPAIDADLVAELTAHQAADAISPAAAARIKHRVLDRIARAETRHTTLHATDDQWQPFKDGVDIKVLNEADGIMSYLLRLAPGAVVDAHRHPIDEECVVLEGVVCIGDDLVVHAGGFHLAHQGTLHAPITSERGATMFLRGASPHVADLV